MRGERYIKVVAGDSIGTRTKDEEVIKMCYSSVYDEDYNKVDRKEETGEKVETKVHLTQEKNGMELPSSEAKQSDIYSG